MTPGSNLDFDSLGFVAGTQQFARLSWEIIITKEVHQISLTPKFVLIVRNLFMAASTDSLISSSVAEVHDQTIIMRLSLRANIPRDLVCIVEVISDSESDGC